jgi:hypothetical protein
MKKTRGRKSRDTVSLGMRNYKNTEPDTDKTISETLE